MFRVESVVAWLVLIALRSEDQLVVGLESMSVLGIIGQFVASKDVGLVESFRKLSVLDCSPLHRHLQLILATIYQESDEVKDGQIQKNDEDDQGWLS